MTRYLMIPARPALQAAMLAVLMLGACGKSPGGTVQDACEGVACSGSGTCFVSGDMPFCDCDDGFHPELLACTANNPSYACADVSCSRHGTCRVEAGLPVCDCDTGYANPAESSLLCFVDPHADATTDPDMEETDEDTDALDTEDLEDEDIISTCGNGTLDEGEDCDDGRNGDPDDGCTDSCTYTCTVPAECDDGQPCTDDTCNTGTHTCVNDTSDTDTVCRPQVESCDTEETCDGSHATCPEDRINCWSSVAAGFTHTCAVATDGALWCWGLNSSGQLGDGTTESSLQPTAVGTDIDWASVTVGWEHTCGVKESGELYCWGSNLQQQLGDGTSISRHEPVRIGAASDWAAVGGGHAHSCAKKTNNHLYCWGYNGTGQLGLDSTDTFASFPTLINVSWNWAELDLGENHSCALNEALNTAYCWGSNNSGQLGDGSTDDSFAVNPIPHFSYPATISAGYSHTCLIKDERTLFCWGLNDSGQLGQGATGGMADYPQIVGSDNNWESLSAGGQHTCALKMADTLYCWGSNSQGQLGSGTTSGTNVPNQIGTDNDWAVISAGGQHTCGIKRDGRLLCWGSNASGQLGVEEPSVRQLVPTLVNRVQE